MDLETRLVERAEQHRKEKSRLGGSVRGYVKANLAAILTAHEILPWDAIAEAIAEEGVVWGSGRPPSGKDIRSLVCRVRKPRAKVQVKDQPQAAPTRAGAKPQGMAAPTVVEDWPLVAVDEWMPPTTTGKPVAKPSSASARPTPASPLPVPRSPHVKDKNRILEEMRRSSQERSTSVPR